MKAAVSVKSPSENGWRALHYSSEMLACPLSLANDTFVRIRPMSFLFMQSSTSKICPQSTMKDSTILA